MTNYGLVAYRISSPSEVHPLLDLQVAGVFQAWSSFDARPRCRDQLGCVQHYKRYLIFRNSQCYSQRQQKISKTIFDTASSNLDSQMLKHVGFRVPREDRCREMNVSKADWTQMGSFNARLLFYSSAKVKSARFRALMCSVEFISPAQSSNIARYDDQNSHPYRRPFPGTQFARALRHSYLLA